MKKTLILFLAFVLITAATISLTTAQTDTLDGFQFDIATVDGAIAGEDGVIVTEQAVLETANLKWAISIYCEKIAANVYRAKQDAIQGSGSVPAVTLGTDEIVIGIHSSTSDVSLIDQYPNVNQKNAAMQVKAGMYFTLQNIDLAAKTSTGGKAILSLTDPSVQAPAYTDIMGNMVDNPSYKIDVTAPQYYAPGDTVNVTMTLKNIVPATGIGLLHLFLYYDPAKVDPVVLNDAAVNAAMDAFLVTAPNRNNWEGLNKLEDNLGRADNLSRYDISFTTTDAASHAKQDGSLVITIPFKVKSAATGTIAFQVPHKETSALDYNLNTVVGNAGVALVEPAPAAESSAASSSASSQAPRTGDSDKAVTLLVAVIALAGTLFIALRKRKSI